MPGGDGRQVSAARPDGRHNDSSEQRTRPGTQLQAAVFRENREPLGEYTCLLPAWEYDAHLSAAPGQGYTVAEILPRLFALFAIPRHLQIAIAAASVPKRRFFAQ
jgi:hypothetical protein